MVCRNCQRELALARPNRRFCSTRCRVAYHRFFRTDAVISDEELAAFEKFVEQRADQMEEEVWRRSENRGASDQLAAWWRGYQDAMGIYPRGKTRGDRLT